MAELIAVGQHPSQQLRRPISEGQIIRVGRSPRAQHGWVVPWDRMISREHADVSYNNGCLLVKRLETRNPIYFKDKREDAFQVQAGEEFRIGTTTFRFEAATLTEPPPKPRGESVEADEENRSIVEKVYTTQELLQTDFGNSGDRMEAFSKLPKLLSKSRNDAEFATHLVGQLLPTMPLGQAAAVIRCRDAGSAESLEFDLIRSVRRESGGEFRPSRHLVRSALKEGASRVHVWSRSLGGQTESAREDVTNSLNLEWAICTPVPGDQPCEWCLYVTGKLGGTEGGGVTSLDDLKPDVRYVELLAQFVGAIRKVRKLQKQQGVLGHFFSPNVVEWLNEAQDEKVLAPRACDVTVLVCDLRGFSRQAEQARGELPQLLGRVSTALNVMTRSIFSHDGVVGDFQGDSALGFWGWPLDNGDGPLPACRAALMIQEEFRRAKQLGTGPLADLRIGVGIAHGPALAGRIGTAQHAKIGAFGPVVQRGIRLETMTKPLRASILLDEATAQIVRQRLSPAEGRCRRLGRVRFSGTDEPVLISELLPPAQQQPTLSDEQIQEYEAAVEALTAGRWSEVLKRLDRMPPEDRAKDFLLIFLALNDYEPPANWDGVITLPAY